MYIQTKVGLYTVTLDDSDFTPFVAGSVSKQ